MIHGINFQMPRNSPNTYILLRMPGLFLNPQFQVSGNLTLTHTRYRYPRAIGAGGFPCAKQFWPNYFHIALHVALITPNMD